MTDSMPTNHETKPHAARQVAVWKEDIQSFFNGDWTRLRSLMMELEEDGWNSECSIESTVAQLVSDADTDMSAAVAEAQNPQAHPSEPCVETKFQTRDRLSELAQLIERRLMTANTNGRHVSE